jgi:outer membrane receptor protein involved in Fe transport
MRILSLIITILCLSFNLLAQNTLSGIVTEEATGQPIPAAHITIGKQTFAANASGEFNVSDIREDSLRIIVSAIGFIKQEITVAFKHHNQFLKISMSEDQKLLDEVIIVGTRTENLIMDIPGRIEMITAEKLRLINNNSVDEVIAFLPGVQTSRTFGLFSHKATVSMRGVSGKEQARTLVLLDGVPVNKSDGGSVNWNLISTGDIEKIEVMKGPGSSLYGGNAMGGIINIVSKKPTKKLEGNLTTSYGTYNTRGIKGSIGGVPKTGYYWAASGLYRKSDGYIVQSYADRISNPHIIKSNFDEKVLNMKAGYSRSEKFSAGINFTFYDDRRGTGEKVYQPYGNTTDHDTYSVRASLSGKNTHWNWNASLFYMAEKYKRVSEWLKDDYTWYDVISKRVDYGLLTGVHRTFRNHTLSAGFDVRKGSVNASDIYFTSTDQVDNRGKMDFYAFYIQDFLRLFNNRITIISGLRYDNSTFYQGAFTILQPSSETDFMQDYQFSNLSNQTWGAVSPRLSIQYTPNDDLRIYAGYSKGFRPSVLDDLCRSGRIRGGFKVANPQLNPEHLHNLEIGGDYKPAEWAKISLSAYNSIGRDFLYYVSTGDSIDMGFGNRPIMIRANISDVRIYGFEMNMTLSPLDYLNFFGAYAWNESIISNYEPISKAENIDLTGKFLTDVPLHSFSAGALIRSAIADCSITGRYVGEMYINDQNITDDILLTEKYPAAFTLDMKVQREFYKILTASLSIQNLLDKKIYESKGAVGPGRFIMLDLGVKF